MSTAMGEPPAIHNDTVWKDTAGKEIWCNGGSMLQRDGRFWWVGYETAPGRPWKINLYSSTDLAEWKFEATIIRREGKFANIGWAGRPAMLYCKSAKKFVVIFEADGPGWTRHKVGFATCDTIAGKYELVNMQYVDGGRSTGDQTAFQDGDDAYLLCTMDKDIAGRKWINQSIAIFKLTPDYQAVGEKVFEGFDNVSGNKSVVPRDQSSREACHIIKVEGTYYWFSSALLGWNSSATMYATAKKLAGPWSDLKKLRAEPDSNDSYNTQHDFIVPVVGSKTTSYVYVGDRYSQWTKRGEGRNIFLPLEWRAGQPVLKWRKDWRIDVATGEIHVLDTPAARANRASP